jgi:hypothetical protein
MSNVIIWAGTVFLQNVGNHPQDYSVKTLTTTDERLWRVFGVTSVY